MEQDPGDGDALGLPGTLTGTCAPGECAELPKGCSAHGGPGAARGARGRLRGGGCGAGAARGARAAASRRGLRGGSANPPAQAPEHRAPGHSPGSRLPWDRQRPGGPRTARTLLPQLSRSAAPPRSLQALQTEFLPELNPGFQSCPHLALHQAGAQQLPQLLTPENQHSRPLPQNTS